MGHQAQLNGRIGIVGAGNMGSGIAQKYASEGFSVVLVDTTAQALELGRSRIENTLKEAVLRRLFTQNQAEEINGRIHYSTSLYDLYERDLVIEAIFENKDAKQQLFKKLDAICSPSCVFATNTSSYFVDELAHDISHPERFIGLHYFYHPAKNRLVEIIKGKHSSEKVFKWVWQLQERIGKIAIESKDAPGFIVNRYFVPWLNEAMRLVEEGVGSIATVEAVAKNTFGCGMGPFELMNVTGVPITFHAASTLAAQLGDFYAPAELIKPLIENNQKWDLSGTVDLTNQQIIAERLLGVIMYLAVQISCEEKVCTPTDCDLGARVGLRWPRGPFEILHNIGIESAQALTSALLHKYPSLNMPKALATADRSQLEIERISSQIVDGVGILTFNRPDSLNALDENMFKELELKFRDFDQNPELKGIVLTGRGKAFVAGADTKFFVDQIKHNNIDRIVDFACKGQDLFQYIDQSRKTIVCALNGMALGGGLELALACDFIVAVENVKLAFPETSIGIYPGLGGTQRLPRRCGSEIAQWLILSGEMVNAQVAQRIALVDAVVNSSELLSKAMEIIHKGSTKAQANLDAELQKIKSWFCPSTIQNENETDPSELKCLQKLQRNAPLALKTAMELIQFSQENELTAGLALEKAKLKSIFSTQDAFIGLSSIGREKPVFKGC